MLFSTHTFSTRIAEQNVRYRILKLKDQLFVYIGAEGSEILSELGMAMQMANNEVLSSEILVSSVDGKKSVEIAKRLSKKLKKQVYLSFNVPVSNDKIYQEIEGRLILEIKEKPDCF